MNVIKQGDRGMLKCLKLSALVLVVNAVVAPNLVMAEQKAAEAEVQKIEMKGEGEFSEVMLKFKKDELVVEKPDGKKYKKCKVAMDGKPKCPGIEHARIADIRTITIVDYSYNPNCQMIYVSHGPAVYVCDE